MGIGRMMVVALAAVVALSGLGAVLSGVSSDKDQKAAFRDIELRKDDPGAEELVGDEEPDGDGDNTRGNDGTSRGDNTGDGDNTRGNDGTSRGDNTGDGDNTRGNDGTSRGDNTGDGDWTAGNDGTAGGSNSYVAPAPAPDPGYGDSASGGGSASG